MAETAEEAVRQLFPDAAEIEYIGPDEADGVEVLIFDVDISAEESYWVQVSERK